MPRVRRSLRTQLTLLYALPFLATGALLLTIPILQYSESAPAPGGAGNPPDETVESGLRSLLNASAVALMLMVAVSFLLGWLIAGRFLRPLWTITATARDISATNLHRRLGLTRRRDEFADLADTLDDLFARLEASFASQRTFVANASHELRTPLTAERTLLQVALADPGASADSLRETCQQVLHLNVRQERLIDALLTLATSERGLERRDPLDLAQVAARVVTDLAAHARSRDIEIEQSLSPAPCRGQPDLLRSLVANLIDNAIRYNVTGGRVTVGTRELDGRAQLAVTNTGPAIPADEVQRLFEPFQRLGAQRAHHDGHGLGLAIVRAIAATHGADLAASPRADGGLEIEVTLPPV